MANQQGWGQQTPAVQSMLQGALGKAVKGVRRAASSAVKRVKSKVRRKVKSAVAKRAKRSVSGGKLKAGSAAAKAWGKRMKALRKKK